ncbi:MAG: NAD(P)/FAD-dependent oxidoreductase [Betaproteobacteria bacterium]|jgi:3-(3-hydroxy-phenyl)propionate hydroxylase
MKQMHVVVVGAGPVGVVAAIAAAQKGFKVTLLDAALEVDHNPRAATTHPSTLDFIDQVGLIDEFVKQGLVARYFQFWDRDTKSRVAQFDHDLLKDETKFPFVVQTEQHKLVLMGLKRLDTFTDASYQFGITVTNLAQGSDHVILTTQQDGQTGQIKADYVIGADGGKSTIRKLLNIEFEGYTWPERFIVLTSIHDFEKSMGCCYRNYFAGSSEWANLFKVTGDDYKGRWRAVFPARTDESDEEALSDASAQKRIIELEEACSLESIVHRNIYNVHQRVAQKFRVGRVMLAGDSSHLNNPIGGLGLNCGIHDAMELVSSLEDIQKGADDTRLDLYEKRRKTLNVQFIQEQTIANKKRLEEKDPNARKDRLDELRKIESDHALQKQFLMKSSLLLSVINEKNITL